MLLPLGFLRADPTQPNEGGLISGLITKAKEIMQPLDALVSDGGFPLETILTVAVPRFVAKQARNFTARRASPPECTGRGRPPERGKIVRPLARSYKGRLVPAMAPDRGESWEEDEVTIRADIWDNLILKNTPAEAVADAPLFSVMTFHDPRFTQPLLVVTNLSLAACHVLALYRGHWRGQPSERHG